MAMVHNAFKSLLLSLLITAAATARACGTASVRSSHTLLSLALLRLLP